MVNKLDRKVAGAIDTTYLKFVMSPKPLPACPLTRIPTYCLSINPIQLSSNQRQIFLLSGLNYNLPLYVYIQRAVDEQFLATVVEGDMNKLEYLLQLGANITYCNPDSKETAISLCINYHSTDLLKFLEKRGSILTTPADAKGTI